MTTHVTTAEYRARLRHWHERAIGGEDIVVTDHGRPTVRLSPAAGASVLDRLEREGLLRRARGRRPAAEIVSVAAPGDSTSSITASRDR